MKKIGGKKLIILGLFILSGLFLLGMQAQALDVGLNYAAATGLGTQDIRITIANIIRVAMGLLGIIAVVLIILGGVQIMTAGGDAEKIAKAKRLLIGAVIGLIIILSAFAIASFVINSIIEAGGGGEPPPPSCEGCACDNSCPCIGCVGACTDPVSSSPSPYICYISGRDEQPKGAKGDYLTIFGGKFLAYDSTDPTTSKVFFRKINADNTNTDYPAVVVLCPGSGSSSWNGTQITVEVPATLPFEASSLNNFYLVVQTNDGNSFDKRPGGNPPKDEFILLAGEPCAGVACIIPNQGQENTASFTVYGKRFDASQGTNNLQFPIDKNAIVGSGNWTDEQIISTVPAGAISKSDNPPNLVRVVKAACSSNGATFNVLCTANACGGNNCCDGGSCADKDSSYCQSGIGESCDSISATSACEIGTNCQAGLVCDSGTCKCREPQPGDSCDLDPSPTICQPNADFCGQDLYCSINPATSCKCEYKPKIEAVLPDNGAPGNFVTIQGRGFGDEPGHVYFYNNREAVYPTTLCAGLDLWQGNQVVVQIPAGAENGVIKLINTDGQEATWDKNGEGGFTINNIIRPGLCGTDPVSGGVGTPVTMAGINFGITKDSVKIGGQEFDNKVNWTWSDTSITNAQVPLIQSAENLPVQVSVAGENSNPTYFNVTTANFPKIDFVDPIQGPAGQFVTIFGSNFGDEAGLVLFDNNEADMANWARATADFPEQCTAAGYWHGTYIIIKVPSGVIPNTLIVVKRKADSAYSNTIDFQYCPACALTPGICAIVPDQGPVGTTGVTLYGEGFGALGLNSLVKFWQDKIIPNTSFNTSTWTNIQIGQSGTAPITVPTTAITGPVQAVNNDGKVSNKVQFTVADCRVQKDICPTGKICCQADGICKTQAACAVAPIQVNMCTYGWTFKTGQAVILNPPRVIESITCVDNTQSPTPWKKSVDNCINSVVSARFDKVMNSDSLNSDNIKIFKCNSGNADFNGISCTPVAGRLDAITGSGSTVVGFTFTPADNLNKNTWYLAFLNGAAGGIKSAEPDSLLLDGDNNGQPGSNYTWYFKTRDSDLACDVDHVVVAPAEALIERITDNQLYNAFALAANCNILNGDAYNWRWYKKYSDGVREEGMSLAANHGIATISNNDVEPGPPNGNVDPHQLATPKKQGLTYIGAEVSWEALSGYDIKYRTDDNNKLVIDLNIPEITSFYPKDGLVRSEVNTYVTISGQNFGTSQGASQVLFDDVIADMADCDQAWSDEIIKVKAPKTQPILASNTPTYKLPAKLDKQDGMAVFYDFEESGNVIIKDQIDGLDGEIKGAPQRTSDQFGQALQLNGTADYIKLPNTLNQATGSLELWFKPQASGTLFSASNGTGTDLFSLDYIVAQNTAGLIKSNEWNYLVYTYDGTTPLLYVNGFKFTTFDKGISKTGNFIGPAPAKTSILIGAKDDGGIKNYFKGSIDGFAIHNRILVENEVLNHYGLNSGQVLFLKFEDIGNTITDSSANGFAGISISDPAKSIVRINEGFYGKAINFPSVNPYSINIANDPSLNFNNGMTIEGWIKVSAGQPTHIFYNSDSVAFRSTIGDFMRLTLQINTGSGVESLFAQSTNKLVGDQWNYFAGTYDGQTIRVYLNGIKTEFSAPGYLNQINNSVCIGSCSGASPFAGSLDEIAVYNRVLSEEEIASRVGINDNSWLKVQTSFGSDTTDFNNNNIKQAGETFTFSDNVYPFLCSLKPEAGLEGTAVVATGDNLGDSNKTTFKNIVYGVGSYVHFSEVKTPDILSDDNIKSWANKLLDIINPYSDVGPIGAEGIPVFASIDPYSEPYNDTNPPPNGVYDSSEPFADTNNNLTYSKRKVCSNNANKNCKQDSDCATPGICVTASVSELASNTLPFYLKPVITSISPDNGPIKTWVTIRGYNFGNERGQVFFYNNKETDPERPPEPCQNTWTNTQIIVEVPLGAESGDLYLVTAPKGIPPAGLESNHVTYTVNDKPLGAGLCQIIPASGKVGAAVTAQGDRFGETQAANQSQLVFTPQKNAVVSTGNWTNQNIVSTVPAESKSGDVVVTKKFQIGQTCAGFHISTWCPSGQYDILYEDVPSNPVYFEVLPGTVTTPPKPCATSDNCKACGAGTSSCINGYCSPYISSFSPVLGAAGTWVNLEGCYFCSGSSDPGSVYFTGQYSPTDLTENLNDYVAHYPFTADANDAGPNHYPDGIPFNASTINFDGQLNLASKDNFVSAAVPITESFAVIVWAKSATSSWNNNGWIASSRQIPNGFVIHPNSGATTWSGYIYGVNGYNEITSNDVTYDITKWHQYGVMYNALTGVGSMIRDGRIVGTNTLNLTRTGGTVTIDFGHDQNCTNPANLTCRFGQGAISEARIYNKSLSSEEIWALYSSTYKGAGSLPAKIGYYKKALNPSDSNPECGNTWNCNPDGTSSVKVEVPNKFVLPNMDCPTGSCPPAGYDINDAIDGPIKLITAAGLSDTTKRDLPKLDVAPTPNFDVSNVNGPNICRLIPDNGPANTTVKIIGENLGDAPQTGDQVNFAPTGILADLLEPFFDNNKNSQLDSDETFVDINKNSLFDTIARIAYTFNISSFIINKDGNGCPPTNGWEKNHICFAVPTNSVSENAGGEGTKEGTATDDVSVTKDGAESTKLNFTVTYTTNITTPPKPGPKVSATVPNHGELEFCRNGIVDIYFDSLVNTDTIEKINAEGELVKNINLEACAGGAITVATKQGIIASTFAYVKNVVVRLFGLERQAAAQLSGCDPVDTTLRIGVLSNKTAVSIIPAGLLDPGKNYRVIIKGGAGEDEGIKNLAGIKLDNSNTPVSDPNDYIFEFGTLGTPSDDTTGICDAQWIDIKVYRTNLGDNNAELRSNDLFTCAGKDDCQLENDYDQDDITPGNQHKYEAVAKYSGDFTLKANYQWSKNDNTDPQRAYDIYNNRGICPVGSTNYYCQADADCGSGTCDLTHVDLSDDVNIVSNTTGLTNTTAKPIKEARAQLVVQAQAERSLAAPAQRSFNLYTLMCENSWPALADVSQLIDAYNFHTYYCRDAGPPGPEGDLPAAKILIPAIENRSSLENGDFNYGTLFNWLPEGSGDWTYQPVFTDLSGWLLDTSKINIGGEAYYDGETFTGVLAFQQFVLEGTQLRFKIGGTNHAWPELDVEMPSGADIPENVAAVVLAIYDPVEAKFYIRKAVSGAGTNLLTDQIFDISANQGKIAIIKIYDTDQAGYVMFDELKQYDDQGVQMPLRF